jgi:hypothetical protein
MSEEREQNADRLVNEEAEVEGHMKANRPADETMPAEDVEAHVKSKGQTEDSGDNS